MPYWFWLAWGIVTPCLGPLVLQAEMEKDGEAQQQSCKTLIQDAIARSDKFIDKTVQLSNVPALTGYLLGNSAAGGPVMQKFDSEVAAGTFDYLAKQVR